MLASMVITRFVAKKNLRCATERQETIGALTGIVEEYYNGRNVIKAYNHESQSLEQVTAAAEKNRAANQKADFLTNCVNPLIRLLTRLANVVIAIIAGKAMLDGTMTVGVVQAFFQYVSQIAEPLTEASFMINSLQSALASARRTFELLDGTEEIPDPAAPARLENAKGTISFSHVSFGCDPDRLLMKNISFAAKPGQKIAVVGSTGAGKTTLVNLLMRFYEVNGGKITIDGVNTAEMTRSGLRKNFGMVLQDTWLFGGTVAENIAYSKPDASREEIIAAAKAAKVDYFIRTMPKGYDTMLDNEAANLPTVSPPSGMRTSSCSWRRATSSSRAATKSCSPKMARMRRCITVSLNNLYRKQITSRPGSIFRQPGRLLRRFTHPMLFFFEIRIPDCSDSAGNTSLP